MVRGGGGLWEREGAGIRILVLILRLTGRLGGGGRWRPDDSADRPAMPCELHTPGPQRTLPSALGPGAVLRPHSARHAERSRLHPEAPRWRPLRGRRATRTLSSLLPQPPAPPLARGGRGVLKGGVQGTPYPPSNPVQCSCLVRYTSGWVSGWVGLWGPTPPPPPMG